MCCEAAFLPFVFWTLKSHSDDIVDIKLKIFLIYHILILSLFKAHLEGLLIARECLRPCLHLVHVLAAVDLVLQRVLLVEVRLLQMFLEPRTEVSTHLALQVTSDPLPLELDHPELGAGVGGHRVLVQGADATHLLQQNTSVSYRVLKNLTKEYLTVEAFVLVDPLALVLVRGDDGHCLVATELVKLWLLVRVMLSQVAADSLHVLGSLGAEAAHESLDGLKWRNLQRLDPGHGVCDRSLDLVIDT